MSLTHLECLEAESIHIMREVVSEAERPVMLYSTGKDSSVMVHLARKAFHPGKPPFPLLHIDTTWKFRDMYEFRDRIVKALGLELVVHVNQDGLQANVNPSRAPEGTEGVCPLVHRAVRGGQIDHCQPR